MASLSSSSVATVSRAVPTQATMAAPFTGLKSNVAFPVTKKEKNDFSSLPSNGGRVQCMNGGGQHFWDVKNTNTFITFAPLSSLRMLRKSTTFSATSGFLVWNLNWNTDLSTVSTTGHQGTMMEDTGQCGSCPCLGALTRPK
ncbi:ribulose bisphosphate carboxylase small chain, chloroplastic isoform X2 [Tanacetum coccineum]